MAGQSRRSYRQVDGILLLDKPVGLSSNAALQKVRRAFAAAKAGHTGNLDVMAGGLLPLCFGEATKVSAYLLEADKIYVADLALGVTTSTGDSEGEITKRSVVPVLVEASVRSILAGFVGDQSQIPPMHSALKRNGRPLYEYARAGIELERLARKIRIFRLDLLGLGSTSLRLEVHCSKGTYIRTLAEDIGQALGTGAHLTGLCRTQAGPFSLADAHPLSRFEGMDIDACSAEGLLKPIDSALGGFPAVTVSADGARVVSLGQRTLVSTTVAAGLCRIYAPDGRFLGMGETAADGSLAPRRMMRARSGEDDQSR